jgi:hypothetical protein
MNQAITSADAVIRVQAKQRAGEIEREMDEIDKKLRALLAAPRDAARQDDPGPDPAQVHDQVRSQLYRIDFRQVERAVTRVLDGDAALGRAGLLLFQRGSSMSGRLCAERVTHLLKSRSNGLFRDFSFEFQPGDRNDSAALLRHLARDLNLDLDGRSAAEQVSLVSEGLCGSLQSGSIALLTVGACDLLTRDAPTALQWLATDFWPRLLSDLGRVARGLPAGVTVIALLFFDAGLPTGALSREYRCTASKPHRDKLLEIKLRSWTRQEVADWLAAWGMPGQPAKAITAVVDHIMHISDGRPYLIENELLKYCIPSESAR